MEVALLASVVGSAFWDGVVLFKCLLLVYEVFSLKLWYISGDEMCPFMRRSQFG